MKVVFEKRSQTLFEFFTEFWTRGMYHHCELMFSNGDMFSSDGKQGARWIRNGGYMLNAEDWDYVVVPCTEVQEKEVRFFCDCVEGKGYDFVGLGFSFLPIPIGWQKPDAWFCSEICAAALQRIGLLCGYTPARISPNRLHRLLVPGANNGRLRG